MSYSVKITDYATEQIKETISYISKILLVPETAAAWSDYLQKAIAGLETMPERFPLVDEEPWRSKGIRKMPVKNFIVYYLAHEESKTVWITAVIYARRDQINSLMNMP